MKKIFDDVLHMAFLAILFSVFVYGIHTAFAATTTTWAPPTTSPGQQNIGTPITDSGVGQVKDGGLGLGATLTSTGVGLDVLNGSSIFSGPVTFNNPITLGGVTISSWPSGGSANAITTDSSSQSKAGLLTLNGGLTIGSGQFILPGGSANNSNGWQSVFDWSGDGQNYIRGNTIFDAGDVKISNGYLYPYGICMNSGTGYGTYTCGRNWPAPIVTQRSVSSAKVKSGTILTATCGSNEQVTGGGYTFGANGGRYVRIVC